MVIMIIGPPELRLVYLIDSELIPSDSLLPVPWIFCCDEFEIKGEATVRRQWTPHRKEIGRNTDLTGERDEISRV